MSFVVGSLIETILRYKNPGMPGFKHTWTNTYDFYGQHPHRRCASPDEFRDMLPEYDVTMEYNELSRILVRKSSGGG